MIASFGCVISLLLFFLTPWALKENKSKQVPFPRYIVMSLVRIESAPPMDSHASAHASMILAGEGLSQHDLCKACVALVLKPSNRLDGGGGDVDGIIVIADTTAKLKAPRGKQVRRSCRPEQAKDPQETSTRARDNVASSQEGSVSVESPPALSNEAATVPEMGIQQADEGEEICSTGQDVIRGRQGGGVAAGGEGLLLKKSRRASSVILPESVASKVGHVALSWWCQPAHVRFDQLHFLYLFFVVSD